MIGFRFTSNWSRELCDLFNQSQSEVKQNHCNSGLLSTINYKLLYFCKIFVERNIFSCHFWEFDNLDRARAGLNAVEQI